jgi:predicted O-methyltransferase YrrM
MRALFGVVGLLVVVAIVGLLAKKQLTLVAAPASAPGVVADAPAQAPRQQVEQVRQAVDTLMQAPRAMPDDTK